MTKKIDKKTNGMKKIIVMIPAYNEEKNIAKVIKGIPRRINATGEVKILVIDDGSEDNTVEVAKKAGADYLIKNKRNMGLGVNFRKGIDASLKLKADIIVNIDADGQFNPNDIEELIRPILYDKADVVTTSRFMRPELTKNIPWIKKWGNKRFTNLISKITGQKFTDTQCGFRAYSKESALRLNLFGKFTYTQEAFIDLANKGLKIEEVSLPVIYKKERKSHISGNLRRYGFKSLAIIARATRDSQPLTFFGMPGLAIFSLGFIGAGFSFWYWLTHLMTTPVKQLFNVSVFLIIFGVSLGVLGLLADMIRTLKITQDEILYRLKKQEYDLK